MKRSVLVVVLGVVVLAALFGLWTLYNLAASPPASTTTAAPPAETRSAPPRDTSAPETPRPAAPAARTPRPVRPAPPPAPSPAPEAPPPPTTGTLHIDSDVAGANVFLDRQFLGTTPLTAPDIAPGSHQLDASVAGYDGIGETIDVAAGSRDLTLEFKTIRLDASIAVIHQHAFGSCRGTLSATPAGIKYDTDNTKDAFSAPLTDIAAFDVDYLAKQLKLKLKNGKSYTFTDPDGNADRLFVFHRDVEKALERMKKQ